jgi:hypothetical protein
MIEHLYDQAEEDEITAAEFAVEEAQAHYAQLHVAAAARIVRLVFPDAMSLVVDAGLADGQPDSCEIELVEVSDGHGRSLWTPESPPRATSVPWSEFLSTLASHLTASFDARGGFGWAEVVGGGLDRYSLALPASSAGQPPSEWHKSSLTPTRWI